MTTKHFVIATAGHVDHGKSALVHALTGTDPDRLPEEKARGVTIDLGFAHLCLASTDGDTEFQVGIVDVPGHEDFVRNMVAGVGAIDLALIVVAADDGWMPQTEEHLQILEYLGVSHAIVVLSKADLLPQSIAGRAASIREKLKDTAFTEASIIPVSVLKGHGLDDLRQTLIATLTRLPGQPDIGKPRLAVDRVFSLHGIGTVVTGTLTGGSLHRGQAVTIQPSGRAARLRGVQSANQDIELSRPGMRTALNLPDLEISTRTEAALNQNTIRRGDVVTVEGLGQASTIWNVLLRRSARAAEPGAARCLKHGTRVQIHLGSTRAAARVLLMDAPELGPGESDLAQLRFDIPIFAFAGDRFVLRDWAENATLAGGIVLEPNPEDRAFRGPENRKFLQARAAVPDNPQAYVDSQLDRDKVVPLTGYLTQSRFSESEVLAAVVRLIDSEAAINSQGLLLSNSWWTSVKAAVLGAVDDFHQSHPDRLGFPLQDVQDIARRHLRAQSSKGEVQTLCDILVADLTASGFRRLGSALARNDFRPALPPHLVSTGARVRHALTANPLEPPSAKEIAPDPDSRLALRFLVETGEAMEISAEVVLSTRAYLRAIEQVRTVIHRRGPATVSELKQALGTSRRIMVPLLERLDRDGITVRIGDRRQLPATAAGKQANAE